MALPVLRPGPPWQPLVAKNRSSMLMMNMMDMARTSYSGRAGSYTIMKNVTIDSVTSA